MECFYKISNKFICIKGNGAEMRNIEGFSVFRTENKNEKPIMVFNTESDICYEKKKNELQDLYTFDTDGIKSIFSRHKNGYAFRMKHGNKPEAFMWQQNGNFEILSDIGTRKIDSAELRFMVWIAFGLSIAPLKSIAVHTSTIVYENKAVLFLGESGTGKSTHTGLWLKNIKGSHLLNDDSPIICVENGQTIAYGSPWSGKTPCYKDERVPVAAIVRLSQAPYNKITKHDIIGGFSALQPSCPPQFAYDDYLSDLIYHTLSDILKTTPVYHLECLPNDDAALLSFGTIFGK